MHYSIQGDLTLADLKGMFPDAKANEMNFVLFSTSGVHGSYATIEQVEMIQTTEAGLRF